MKENQRIMLTKRLLKESLLSLLKTKDIDRVAGATQTMFSTCRFPFILR